MASVVGLIRSISRYVIKPGTNVKNLTRGIWYKYKIKRYDREKNYKVDRNEQEKELGLMRYKLKEYEKYRDEGSDADIKFPLQFSSFTEYVDALVESGQVLDYPTLNYKGEKLEELDNGSIEHESILNELNTFKNLNKFEYPKGHTLPKSDEIDLYTDLTPEQPINEKEQTTTEKLTMEEFVEQLRNEGGDKIMEFNSNIYHFHPSNFDSCCKSITGHKLADTLLILGWYNDPIHDKFKSIYNNCIVAAKLKDFNLEKTYVVDCKVLDGAWVNKLYKKYFIKGRGRAGATDTPITARIRVILQERDKPLKHIVENKLEHIHARFRARIFNIIKTPMQVYEEYIANYPEKNVYTCDKNFTPLLNEPRSLSPPDNDLSDQH